MIQGDFAFSILNSGAGIHLFHACDVTSLQQGKARYQTGSEASEFRDTFCRMRGFRLLVSKISVIERSTQVVSLSCERGSPKFGVLVHIAACHFCHCLFLLISDCNAIRPDASSDM